VQGQAQKSRSLITRTCRSLAPAVAIAGVLTIAGWTPDRGEGDPLEQGFKRPPEAALPRTWWHWTRGNVTKEGITKDLEWMRRVGIGGFQLADVNFGSGQSVEPKTPFGSAEWLEALRHAAVEADRLKRIGSGWK